MPYTGEEEHEISLEDASALTGRYRAQMSGTQIKGGYFGKNAILDVVGQEGCVGIRYYYGLDPDDKHVLVIVGVDSDGNDLTEGMILEFSMPCPDYCSATNDLNT